MNSDTSPPEFEWDPVLWLAGTGLFHVGAWSLGVTRGSYLGSQGDISHCIRCCLGWDNERLGGGCMLGLYLWLD